MPSLIGLIESETIQLQLEDVIGGFRASATASSQSPDAQQQLGRIKWLCQTLVRTIIEALDPLPLCPVVYQHDDRCSNRLAEMAK